MSFFRISMQPGVVGAPLDVAGAPLDVVGAPLDVAPASFDGRLQAERARPRRPKASARRSIARSIQLDEAKVTTELFQDNLVIPFTDRYRDATNEREFRPSDPRAKHSYRAQPLDGIAFTAPYLHNGSVRTVEQLLLPGDQREKKFWTGTREFDAAGVGYANVQSGPNAFEDDTSRPGKSNRGHEGPEYGTTLSASQRRALLEYLKSL